MIAECARRRFWAAAFGLALCVGAGLGASRVWGQATPDYAALLAAPDRSAEDKQADKRRDPVPFLAFAGVRPGMNVLDMGAGAGYSTELLARAVAPNGFVLGQFPPDTFPRAKEAFEARLKTPGMENAYEDMQPFDDPVPVGIRDLDLITFLFYYHDTTYMKVDRAQMDRKMFAGLKPGGYLVIADHSAKPGSDISVGKELHRIDEAVVRQELGAAGFKLVAEGNFWRAAGDPRDFSTQKPTGPVDNFVLKFQKPN